MPTYVNLYLLCIGTVHYFYRRGAGSYQQNTSQKHMTSFVETKKVMTPPFGIYKKSDVPPPAYATILIIPNNNTK